MPGSRRRPKLAMSETHAIAGGGPSHAAASAAHSGTAARASAGASGSAAAASGCAAGPAPNVELSLPPPSRHEAMLAVGVDKATFDALVQEMQATFAPSASSGQDLLRLNDHAGVLAVAAHDPTFGVSIAERLTVVAERPPGAGHEGAQLYFLKGYGDRLVSVHDLATAVQQLQHGEAAQDGAAAEGEPRMETALRTALLSLSADSQLHARRHKRESKHAVMMLPPNPTPLPQRANTWANLKYMLPQIQGPAGPQRNGVPMVRIDYNSIENRALLFLDDAAATNAPTARRASHDVSGPVLAELQGIRSWEVMGPAGVEHGVKGARMQQALTRGRAEPGDTVLRVTTEDQVVHEITFGSDSVRMRMLDPAKPGALAPPSNQPQIDVYSHQGVNIGPMTSASGFPDPALQMSTGEQLPLGPLLVNRSGTLSAMGQAVAGALRTAVTFDPRLGTAGGLVSGAVNTAVKAACLAATVYGWNNLLHTVSSNRGVLKLQAQAFSASGAGPVDSQLLAGAVTVMVVSQHLVTLARDLCLKALPQSLTGRDMPEAVRQFALPAVEEIGRLLLNFGVQSAMGLPRGHSADPAMLAAQGAVFGLMNWTAQRQGAGATPQHHPAAAATFATLGGTVDIALRAAGAAMDAPGSTTPAVYAEAAVSRAITRGYDKTLVPVIALVLGMVANSMTRAGAVIEHQVHSENQNNNAVSGMKTRLDAYLASGDEAALQAQDLKCLALMGHMVEVIQRGLRMQLQRSGIRSHADRAVQELTRASASADDVEAAAGSSAAGPSRANSFSEHERAFNRIASGQVTVRNALDQLAEGPAQRARQRISVGQQRNMLPVRMTLANYMVDASGQAARGPLRPSSGRIPTADSTFTVDGQAAALPVHQAMTEQPGFGSRAGDMSAQMQQRCLREMIRYTEESQFFHYPLRWSQTGQVTLQPVVPGIDLPYRTLNRPNNADGSAEGRFDPIQALYVNLGCAKSERMGAMMHRAVVTEARYVDPQLLGPDEPPAPDNAVQVGQHVGLTEIFSISQSAEMAAAFGQALSHGAADRSRSQRLLVLQETGVNVTQHTDLVQAEAILMPGALFLVESVKPGVLDDENPNEAIGQVVCLRQVDTVQALLGAQPDAVFGNVRNYFLGTAMHPPFEGGDPTLQRLLNPYTSASAPRTTKDAIHAAILRGDPIVAYLDEAVRNVHHEFFLDKHRKGPPNAPKTLAAQLYLNERTEQETSIKEQAQTLSTRLRAQEPTAPISSVAEQHGHELLAWLVTSLLRQPIQLHAVEMSADGTPQLAPNPQVFNSTYDKVLLAGQTPVVLGVCRQGDAQGVYVCTMSDGQAPELSRVENPPGIETAGNHDTVQNLVHAFVFSSQPDSFDYARTRSLTAGPKAQNTAKALWEKMQEFVGTDYLVLQQALTEAPWEPQPPV
jgi:hypothetical protein